MDKEKIEICIFCGGTGIVPYSGTIGYHGMCQFKCYECNGMGWINVYKRPL